ncbi:unnamed protein product [Urochloa humidicola]
MGKKRTAAAAPVFPFPAAAAVCEPDHFSDYGFDSQLVSFFAQPEAKRPSWGRRHHGHQPPPPLESARFKLQKPISKKHHHLQKQQRRRRWWSSAASAALLLFKRPSSSSSCSSLDAAPRTPTPYGSPISTTVPLYLADDGDAGTAACACWAPAMRSGHLAAAELGTAADVVPYVSLRSATSLGGRGAGGAAPAMPIYLIT